MAVQLMEAEEFTSITPSRIAERCGLALRTVNNHLKTLRDLGALASNGGSYASTESRHCADAENRHSVPKTGTGSAVPKTGIIGVPKTGTLSIYKRSRSNPLPPLAAEGAPPLGWFEDLCGEIGDRMPPRRGRGGVHIAALTQVHRSQIAAAIREGGGWLAFDKHIRLAMLDAAELKNPAGFIRYLFGQHAAGRMADRPAGDLPPFASRHMLAAYENDVHACAFAEARGIVGSNNPKVPHYAAALKWLEGHVSDRSVAEFIAANSWQFTQDTAARARQNAGQ